MCVLTDAACCGCGLCYSSDLLNSGPCVIGIFSNEDKETDVSAFARLITVLAWLFLLHDRHMCLLLLLVPTLLSQVNAYRAVCEEYKKKFSEAKSASAAASNPAGLLTRSWLLFVGCRGRRGSGALLLGAPQ